MKKERLPRYCLLWLLALSIFFLSGRKASASEGIPNTTQGDLAASNDRIELNGIWDGYNMDELRKGMDKLFPEYQIDVRELFHLLLEGRITDAIKELWNEIGGKFGAEAASLKNIFVSILVLGILSALFANFSDIFKSHQIADVSFYFLYLLLMMILTKCFLTAAEITVDTVGNIVLFVKLFLPAYFMAVGVALGPATAVSSYQLMLLAVYGVEKLLEIVMIPFIYSYVLLSLINGIWMEEKLSMLLDFLKKGIVLGLKLALGAVTGISLFQSMITPVIDALKTSAVQKALSCIPGIGGLAEGVTQMVIGSAVLIKNSIGLLMLLLLLGVCAIPLLKLLLIACMMKGSAALVGIVSDKRIAGCTDRVGDGSLLLFRTALTAMALFLIMIAIVAYTTGRVR